jgi:hypothetical protein
MSTWSKRKRDRYLALARYFDGLAASLRKRVREHTPKRATKPKLVQDKAA